MKLSSTIARQLTRLEAKIGTDQPQETLQQQYERRQREAARFHWNLYSRRITEVLAEMDEEFCDIALAQIQAAPEENIVKVSECHETGGEGLLPPLASGVCRLARRLMHQEGLSFPVPCALPASVCRFLIEHGDEVFRSNEWVPVGSSGRTVMAPQYAWLDGSLLCEKCYFPTPYKQMSLSKGSLQTTLDGPETPIMPFRACPACAGSLFWMGG